MSSYSSSSANSARRWLHASNGGATTATGANVQVTFPDGVLGDLTQASFEAARSMKRLTEALQLPTREILDAAGPARTKHLDEQQRERLAHHLVNLRSSSSRMEGVSYEAELEGQGTLGSELLGRAIVEVEREGSGHDVPVPLWAKSLLVSWDGVERCFLLSWKESSPGYQTMGWDATADGAAQAWTISLAGDFVRRDRHRTGYLRLDTLLLTTKVVGALTSLLRDVIHDIKTDEFQTLVQNPGEGDAIRSILGT